MPADPDTFAIIGAAMEVHTLLGPGFLEPVYQDALAIELADRSIPFAREAPIPIDYKGRRLASVYRADFLCYGSVIVELKALKALTTREESQVMHYLKATGLQRGLLINFGVRSLETRRFVLGYDG